MAGMLEPFVAFGTDIVGLERLLRLLQAILLVLTSYPSLLSNILTFLLLLPPFYSSSPPSSPPVIDVVSTATSLLQLQTQLNLARRTIRLFWFLGSFQSSWALLGSRAKGIDSWLGVLAHSAHGMFGLVESATLLDLVDGGVTLFGPVEAVRLDEEAQMLWLVALYASALGSGAKILGMLAYRPVPPTGDGFGAALDDCQDAAAEGEAKEGKEDKAEAEERARKHKEQQRRVWADEFNAKAGALGSKLLADLLDMVIPASRLGWLKVDGGLVGIAMVCSTVLSGKTVWDRCRQTT
ncbi:peroxisomal biogenesis factor 11 (PEX11) domain-containing protein [Hirsutella rhossiliensis]|uniref:Peroxisomal biogenesis factor 11 (PEX11) domain-containing protein n=1 Tax=Hirsutella rhossiliensis TaxID=111463 RepID=A0A9P8MLU7_9HYPO|nr:peroxisomal biogenesis factor 11 (PEX11) domain-containing protein [Hirsutella rhossiliensis]KAH0958603.1 peroxisomal biogenesis factor 11 (PEX11) domain-containing protein [Hirsutella rhossiliensis]